MFIEKIERASSLYFFLLLQRVLTYFLSLKVEELKYNNYSRWVEDTKF